MIFNYTEDYLKRQQLFIVSMSDVEIEAISDKSGKLRQFEEFVLRRLALTVAGWLFKHHKDELMKPIMENVIEKVSKEVSRDILNRLGLPLESTDDPK